MTDPSARSRKQRRRVEVAHLNQKRVRGQQDRFANEYGKAQTTQQRFAVTAGALRAAAAPGRHQVDQAAVDRELDRLTNLMRNVLTQLHETQYAHATKVIRTDERRIERNERRLGSDGRTQPESA